MAPKKRALSPASSPTRRAKARGPAKSPTGRARTPRNAESPDISASPSSATRGSARCSELELPMHPVIEKGYMQAILLPVHTGNHDHAKLPAGFTSWQQVPINTTYSRLTPEEVATLNAELFREKETNDLNEKLKPVSASFVSASQMLGRDVCVGGNYGKIEAIRMGSVTMHVYYVVKFASGLIQHFQNFEIEKHLVSPDAPVEDDKAATAKKGKVSKAAPVRKKPAGVEF